MFVGPGAGGGPTASAVVADVIDIARGVSTPTFGLPANDLKTFVKASEGQHEGSYYMRLMVKDEPGVIAGMSEILRDHNVSMESVIQRSRDPGQDVPVIVTTHATTNAVIRDAIKEIESMSAVVEPPRLMRIEIF